MFCSIRLSLQTCVFPSRALSISPERGAVPLRSPGKSGSSGYWEDVPVIPITWLKSGAAASESLEVRPRGQ